MLLLAACGQKEEEAKSGSLGAMPKPQRFADFNQVTRGGRLFQEYCASCHGVDAQGAANWRKKSADGKYPAPPLDGTGHAWHHPEKVLLMTIRDGTKRLGGSMPAWGDKLSDQDMRDIIAWFQAKWPEDIYTEWARRNARAK
ncbi:MAG TPA: cytochrome c [Chromatiales bacterium]|nr:cytochrome c [Chromatiales bacterium]